MMVEEDDSILFGGQPLRKLGPVVAGKVPPMTGLAPAYLPERAQIWEEAR